MTETPEEMYRIIEELKDAIPEVICLCYNIKDIHRLLNHYRSQVQVLREAVHQIREIYVGSDGFVVETAPEAYQQHLIKQMYDEANVALAATEPNKWSE